MEFGILSLLRTEYQKNQLFFYYNNQQLNLAIIFVKPNVSIKVINIMAPALTEPISPTNKLSESTSSASPRPIIISNLLITSNNSNNNNNNNSLYEIQNNIIKNNNLNKNINNIEKNKNIYPICRPPLKTFCAFQSAFEEAIAKARKTKSITLSDSEIDITEKNIKLKNNTIKRKTLIKSNTAKLSKESLGINKKTILSNGPTDDNLSSEQIVTNLSTSTSSSPISRTIDRDNQQMGPMCDAQATNSSTIETVQQHQPILSSAISTNTDETTTLIYNDKDLQNVQQLTKINNNNNNNNNQFITLDSDIEEAINNTLNNKDSNKQQEQILLKFEEFQHMDLQNCDDSTIVPSITSTSNQQQCSNTNTKIQTEEIELSQELISTCTTDTTVTVSDSDNIFDDNFAVSSQQQQQQQHHQQITLETSSRRSPPRTPTSTSSLQQQHHTTPLSVSLTPQSTGSGSGGVMGLQKDFIKDSTEMDQVLGDMDLLQVLKGFDSTSGGGEAALCDLAGSLGLFNDVDVMSYEEIVTPAPKNLETDEIRSDIERRQQQMQRKCDFLLRRLRKIQARSMSKHTSEEISGLFEWTNRLIRRKDHDQLPDICYDDDKHRPVTQAAIRSLLKRIDSVATTQHSNSNNNSVGGSTLTVSLNINNSTAQKKNKNILGRTNSLSTITNNFSTNDNKKLTIIQKYDSKSTDEIGHIAGLLQTEMREVQSAFDSDVTASSSGGESADEMVTYNNQVQQSLSISKRAAWRWARDRSAIASRWTWLCAQISDLEYRIRQHNELYLQIKKNKGSVAFEKFSNLSTTSLDCSSTVDTTTNMFGANGLRGACVNNKSQQLENTSNLTESPTTSTTSTTPPNGAYDQTTGASRTRSFQRIGFRKRKLLQTANVHTVSKKAARPSTVKCGCQWPLHPCALCTGRSDPTAPRDLPDTMTESERVALLDPGFHPVLSFPEDVPNSIHIEATLQIPEWQNRIIRNSSKLSSKNSILSLQKSHNRDERSLSTSSTSKKFRTSQKNSRKQQQQDMLSSPISGNQVGAGISSSANKIKSSKNRKNHEYHSGISSMMTTQTSSPQHQFNSSLSGKSSKQRKLLSSSNVAGATLINNDNCGDIGTGSTNGSSCGGGGGTSNMNGFQNAFAESLVNLNCDNLDGAANGSLYPRSKNSSPTPTGRGNGEVKDGHHYSGGGSYKYERMMERRNRNSYDIDNIVIPYSVAAATRVEILPYKEIPTPKWRVIGDDEDELEEPNKLILSTLENDEKFLCPKEINSICTNVDIKMNNNNKINETTATVELLPPPSPIVIESPANETAIESDKKINNIISLTDANDTTSVPKSPCTQNYIKQEEDDEIYNEDISEEAIHNRHERALLEERKKFSTFLKFPWSTRSRANRRIDSRAESSGANTPDPTSPAPNTPSVGGDQESIPSPAAPSTPLTENVDGLDNNNQSTPSAITYPSVNNIYYSAARRGERKRTVSAKKEKDPNKNGGGDDQRRSSSPDPREIIPPFDPLQFPLSDDLYETMLKMMPNHHQLIDECLKLTSSNTDYNNTLNSTESSQTNDTKFVELSNRINNNINNDSSNNSSRKNSISSTQYDTINTSIFSIPNQDLFSNSFNNKNNSNQNYVRENDKSIFENVERQLRLLEDSDTDSAESGLIDEDPNDPEWKQPEK